jgi:hypothetical protein
VQDVAEAIQLLHRLGAPARLVRHHELVAEAANEILGAITLETGLTVDRERVLLGAALHDCGKIRHPEEMRGPGHAHEATGEQMLLAAGVSAEIARACRFHCDWASSEDFEDLLVALADKLWKGYRDERLEMRVVDAVAAKISTPAWEVFARLDPLFERVAEAGPERLERSIRLDQS